MKAALLLLSTLLLASCGIAGWSKPNATQEDFDRDMTRCKQETFTTSCMEKAGWTAYRVWL